MTSHPKFLFFTPTFVVSVRIMITNVYGRDSFFSPLASSPCCSSGEISSYERIRLNSSWLFFFSFRSMTHVHSVLVHTYMALNVGMTLELTIIIEKIKMFVFDNEFEIKYPQMQFFNVIKNVTMKCVQRYSWQLTPPNSIKRPATCKGTDDIARRISSIQSIPLSRVDCMIRKTVSISFLGICFT